MKLRGIKLTFNLGLVLIGIVGITFVLGYSVGVVHATPAASSFTQTGTQLSIASVDINYATFTPIADSSTAGKLFLSSTTANIMKYYDNQGTPVLHTIATLEDAQTFTGTKTFPGVTLTGNLAMAGNAITGTDNAFTIGTAAARLGIVYGTDYRVYLNSGDANPVTQVGNQFLKFGAGTTNVVDVALSRNAVGQFQMAALTASTNFNLNLLSGSTAVGTHFSIYRGSSITATEYLVIGSDVVNPNEFSFSVQTNGGTNRPLIFYNNAAEAFRITIAPIIQASVQIYSNTAINEAFKITNTFTGTPTPNKFMGVIGGASGGQFAVANSADSAFILKISDAGGFQLPLFFDSITTPTATTTGIGASANAGNLLLNVPTGQNAQITVNGVNDYQFASGKLTLGVATDIAALSNTAAAFRVTDGTNPYLTLNTQTATSGIAVATFATSNPSFAGATTPFSLVAFNSFTVTLTGAVGSPWANFYGVVVHGATLTDSTVATVTNAYGFFIDSNVACTGSLTCTNTFSLGLAGNFYVGGNIVTTGTGNLLGTSTAYFGTISGSTIALYGTPSLTWTGIAGSEWSASAYPANIYGGIFNCETSGACFTLGSGSTLPGETWSHGIAASNLPGTQNNYVCGSLSTGIMSSGSASSCATQVAAANQNEVARKYKVSNFYVTMGAGPGTGANFVFTVYDGTTAQAVTCTVVGTGTTCSDLTHSFTASAGDLLSFQVQCTGGTCTATSGYTVGIELDPSG